MNTKEIIETIRGLNRSRVKNKEELIESFCCDILEEQDKDTDAHDNAFLRMLLWAQHPCQGKYGDDGELQCNKCRIDFKRDSVIAIEKKITFKNLQAFTESKDTETKEKLSDYAHKAWSEWMKYLFSKGDFNKNVTWVMPKWAVDRWTKQMSTPYKKLSEEEKESDRHEADKMLLITKVTKGGKPCQE